MSETLYIDSNEPTNVKTTVETTIKSRDTGAQTETKGLKTADFVYKDVAIERKEASDLASSIKDRRLKEQTLRMLEDFEHQYIIVEGDPYNLEYSSLHDNSFIGTMVSRSRDGIGIIHTPDVEGTAYAINKIISKHEGGEEKVEELKRTNADTENLLVAQISLVNGVSKEKARKIAEKIGSLEDMAQYTAAGHGARLQEILETIEGVGPKTSEKVLKLVKTEA